MPIKFDWSEHDENRLAEHFRKMREKPGFSEPKPETLKFQWQGGFIVPKVERVFTAKFDQSGDKTVEPKKIPAALKKAATTRVKPPILKAPTGLTTTRKTQDSGKHDRINITWDDVPNVHVYEVEVMVDEVQDGGYAATNSWTHLLPAGKSARIRVRSIDHENNKSPWSAPVANMVVKAKGGPAPEPKPDLDAMKQIQGFGRF